MTWKLYYWHLVNNHEPNIYIFVTDRCYKYCQYSDLLICQCAKMIKEVLDKKFGPSWHVVVGEGFGFEISYEVCYISFLLALLRILKTHISFYILILLILLVQMLAFKEIAELI